MIYRPNPEFKPSLRKQIAQRVDRAAITLQADLKQTLSISPSPSAPGQPPGVETGNLRRSVQTDRSQVESDLVARVGTNLPYGRWLEYGTRFTAARPWLRTTLAKFRNKLAALLGGDA